MTDFNKLAAVTDAKKRAEEAIRAALSDLLGSIDYHKLDLTEVSLTLGLAQHLQGSEVDFVMVRDLRLDLKLKMNYGDTAVEVRL